VSLKQPHLSRALLALLFAVAFLGNGVVGLCISLSAAPPHVNGLSAVVSLFGLIALAAAVQQLIRARAVTP
jgi:uncharacterized membrane protein HdeD (DUF308 family)